MSDHLVEHIDQRGFRVALVSAGEFQELVTTREWLEECALRESIARGDKDWEEDGCVGALSFVAYAGLGLELTPTSVYWERHHRAFHFALLGACDSAIMLRFANSFMIKTFATDT